MNIRFNDIHTEAGQATYEILVDFRLRGFLDVTKTDTGWAATLTRMSGEKIDMTTDVKYPGFGVWEALVADKL